MTDIGRRPDPVRTDSLGPFLKAARHGQRMTLRDVEEATLKEVSNAYLSQLENSKISKPSPHILHTLSRVLGVSYESLMERAGYIGERTAQSADVSANKQGMFKIENLSADEERALLEHLSYLRWQKTKRG